jgi:hypothetical protein
MFGIDKVLRAKAGFSLLYQSGSGGMDNQHPPNRIFPQGKDVFAGKGQVIGMFPPYKPPFAVLLYGIGSSYQAKSA